MDEHKPVTTDEAAKLPGLVAVFRNDRKASRQTRYLVDLLFRHILWLEQEGRRLAQEASESTERVRDMRNVVQVVADANWADSAELQALATDLARLAVFDEDDDWRVGAERRLSDVVADMRWIARDAVGLAANMHAELRLGTNYGPEIERLRSRLAECRVGTPVGLGSTADAER